MPSDQISDFPSYWPSSIARMTSGAIQYGVPTKEFAGDINEAEPKSAEITKHMKHLTILTTHNITKTYK